MSVPGTSGSVPMHHHRRSSRGLPMRIDRSGPLLRLACLISLTSIGLASIDPACSIGFAAAAVASIAPDAYAASADFTAAAGAPSPAPASDPAPRAGSPVASALHALFDREWLREEREHPVDASLRGDRRFNDRWPDESLTAIDASHRADLAALAALARIDRAALPPADRLNYDLFRWNYRDRLDSWRFHEYVFPLNQLDGIQTSGDLTQTLRFATRRDYEDWIGRLERFGVYMDQTLALLAEGVKERRTLPRIVVERIMPQIASNIVDDPRRSTFYAPFLKLPPSIDPSTAKRLELQARAAISSVVIPAFRRMQRFFTD